MSFSITFSYHPYGHFSVMPWSLLLGSIQHHPPRGPSFGRLVNPQVTRQSPLRIHIFFRKKSLFETFKNATVTGYRPVDRNKCSDTQRLRISCFKINTSLAEYLVKKDPLQWYSNLQLIHVFPTALFLVSAALQQKIIMQIWRQKKQSQQFLFFGEGT